MTEPKKKTPQDRWQAKVGLISKSYKLKKDLVEDFAKSCEKAETTQAKQLSKMMEEFIIKNR